MKAIVDCNSFYCSCERVFKPQLEQKPVVVLSNNDGCIVSRSDEARALGIGMAIPFFKARPIIQEHDVAVFSSNYNLYGNMSWRVMETLRSLVGAENVEVYSVDEAFLDLHLLGKNLQALALDIRHTVETWTGVAVSVGVAPTKTLAKLANWLAKKNKIASSCVWVLDTEEKIGQALRQTPVGGLWGVGRRNEEKLKYMGIHTAWDLYHMPEEWARCNLGGVTGVRLLRELHGQESIIMEDELKNKKMIATTRMFGNPVTDLKDIKEAVATYTSRAAEKLRRQQSAANVISVFIVPKQKREEGQESSSSWGYQHGSTVSTYSVLPRATCVSNELIAPALRLVESIYKEGNSYKKAGVILSGLVPDSSIQGNLFTPGQGMGRYLMDTLDNINFSMRDDIVKFASSGTSRNWKMQRNYHSPRYTTRWGEIPEVG
jgi:DNA polymerase V